MLPEAHIDCVALCHELQRLFFCVKKRSVGDHMKEVSLSEEEISTLKEYFTGHVAVAEKSLSENL